MNIDAVKAKIKKHPLSIIALLAFGIAFLVYMTRQPIASPAIKPANPEWQSYISAHTSGIVSRKSNIYIEFSQNVFSEETIGKSAAPYMEIDPEINGSYTVSGPKEITIIPSSDLKQGQYYIVTLKGDKFRKLPRGIGDFQFFFQVMRQDMTVELKGLVVSLWDDKNMYLEGKIITADVSDPDKIKKVLNAELDSKNLSVEWIPSPSLKEYLFTVKDIIRGEKNKVVKLKWDGKAIGSTEKGEKEIEVPAANVFKVIDAKAVQGSNQHIAVYFSDKIDSKQSLKGLVRLNRKGWFSSVSDNVLKIYPDKRFLGKIVVSLDPGIRNSFGTRLGNEFSKTVVFNSKKPQVRFVGKGNMLPDNDVLSIPFETLNVNSVQVTAFKIFENNIGQFLQTNKLSGASELKRVGRFIWRKTVHIPYNNPDQWMRYDLDATDLLKESPGGIYRLTLSINRSNSSYACSEEDDKVPPKKEKPLKNYEDLYVEENSNWDYAEQYYSPNQAKIRWRDRNDPCRDAYYVYSSNVKDSRNFMASNIGVLAKGDVRNRLLVVTTDLKTSEPMSDVKISVFNFQRQLMASAITDSDGFTEFELDGKPFYLSAEKDDDMSYLKLNSGSVMPVSNFDVGGEKSVKGIKGFIYGERGVWRPGDDMHLVFIMEDKNRIIPSEHPVTMRLYNPRGQLVQTRTNNQPVGNFYYFKLKTEEKALTGNWTVKAYLGNRVFEKLLKVETVKPNRLKIDFNIGAEEIRRGEPVKAKIFSQWLHGASAANLKADVKVVFKPVKTAFRKFSDYVFDDPVRDFRSEAETVFEGRLDEKGKAEFRKEFVAGGNAPGKMSAAFRVRVFETPGSFSSTRLKVPYSPYLNYVGVKLPKGDRKRGMLLTDKKHTVGIATLNAEGKPVSLKRVEVSLYKMSWKWWWDKTKESLARYASSSHIRPIKNDVISTVDGAGKWEFEIKHPSWGRYLLRVCDLDGKHCSGKIFYIDWPGWAGRGREEAGMSASVLNFSSDKEEYLVGEKAIIKLPEATQGRALLTVENGSVLLRRRWIDLSRKKTEFKIDITPDMSPNAYVSVTLIQPHKDKKNDRPIRLYGIIPLLVKNPATVLTPAITSKKRWRPESEVSFSVSEKNGKPMTYTVAVVDEGLLGLTGFSAPDPHSYFYMKEALGVKTWDLYDFVVGAYGAKLERLLALGGGTDLGIRQEEKPRRFPPLVKFLGPFNLSAGRKNTHKITLPSYMGAVRIMVVAGKDGAYGKAEKTVTVKKAITIMPTFPRIIGPNEEITVPVSVFSTDRRLKAVSVGIMAGANFEIIGNDMTVAEFAEPGERIVFFRMKAGSEIGGGKIKVTARSGAHKSSSETYLKIRSPNPSTLRQFSKRLKAGEEWKTKVVPHGLKGTNEVSLEISAIPPLNLEKRLGYLIRYPHGCVEQVTSSVFPQIYLGEIVELDDNQKKDIEKNVNAGINRLRNFQIPGGGFVYWPNSAGNASAWATNYAGHFLVEARDKGYYVPPRMFEKWLEYQKNAALTWDPARGGTMNQAYRVYTLALAGEPEIGAMNRLKETGNLKDTARLQLAAAYKLAGLADAAQKIADESGMKTEAYNSPGPTYGSILRDKAVILNSLAILGKPEGEKFALEISKKLASKDYCSTQSTAYALMALSKFYGDLDSSSPIEVSYALGNNNPSVLKSRLPVIKRKFERFPLNGENISIRNLAKKDIFVDVNARGVPPAGNEKASAKGLAIDVQYCDAKGRPVDVSSLKEGEDFKVNIMVRNVMSLKAENVALTYMFPSGWEIQNTRMDFEAEKSDKVDYQDIRDDRVYSYFSLKPYSRIWLNFSFTAAYPGKYYLPGVSAEAMYEADKYARTAGKWVSVKEKRN